MARQETGIFAAEIRAALPGDESAVNADVADHHIEALLQ